MNQTTQRILQLIALKKTAPEIAVETGVSRQHVHALAAVEGVELTRRHQRKQMGAIKRVDVRAKVCPRILSQVATDARLRKTSVSEVVSSILEAYYLARERSV